ncbi:hypothetical protein GF361_00585 [Candidatus Woesearchaeota archaeon]|nr:hypothetical protein [Candidatus Woesearchaeota archaeon]
MSFIRTKKIKGKEYAYIVENKWKKRGKRVKQKTKKYLGRVYRHSKAEETDFYEFFDIQDIKSYIDEKEKEDIIDDLIRWELDNHGFKEKQGKWIKNNCFLDLDKKKVYNEKENNIALGFNDGFLTTYALRKLYNFSADSEEEGYDFAKMFIEAGINVPKEVFVGIFKKALK